MPMPRATQHLALHAPEEPLGAAVLFAVAGNGMEGESVAVAGQLRFHPTDRRVAEHWVGRRRQVDQIDAGDLVVLVFVQVAASGSGAICMSDSSAQRVQSGSPDGRGTREGWYAQSELGRSPATEAARAKPPFRSRRRLTRGRQSPKIGYPSATPVYSAHRRTDPTWAQVHQNNTSVLRHWGRIAAENHALFYA